MHQFDNVIVIAMQLFVHNVPRLVINQRHFVASCSFAIGIALVLPLFCLVTMGYDYFCACCDTCSGVYIMSRSYGYNFTCRTRPRLVLRAVDGTVFYRLRRMLALPSV